MKGDVILARILYTAYYGRNYYLVTKIDGIPLIYLDGQEAAAPPPGLYKAKKKV